MANTAEQMKMFGYTAEGAQQEADKFVDKDAAPAKDITFMDSAKFVAELTPVIGDAMAAKEVYDELQKEEPNYLLAGALGGATIIGLIPGIGDAAAAAIRTGAKRALDVGKRVEVDPDSVGMMGGNIRIRPKEKPFKLDDMYRDDFDWNRLNLTDSQVAELANVEKSVLAAGGGQKAVEAAEKRVQDAIDARIPVIAEALKYKLKTSDKGVVSLDAYKDAVEATVRFDTIEEAAESISNQRGILNKMGPGMMDDMLWDDRSMTAFEQLPDNEIFQYIFDEGLDRALVDWAVKEEAIRKSYNKYTKAANKIEAPGAGAIRKKQSLTLDDFAYYQDNPATKGREGGEDWVKKQQRYAEEDAARGGSGATKKFFNGPITANLGGMNNNKPLFLDSKFLASLKGANNEVRNASDSKYKELLKDAQDGGFDPNQKGNRVVVGVNHKGEAYIIEGNTRAAVASELGIPSVKVEVRYWNGAETVDGPYSPQNILKYASKETKKFAEGGPLMNKQMEMAFMKQGGIKDDGMTKDPVSGNEIPPGSMATEVRDNIPAMLSDGEYVVPADVLRYYGVNFFENLRGQAKNGLQSMEQNGRIGGTPMTQQDVARNMQQPVMANTGMMLEPEKQQSPQAMGNQTPGFSQPVQSFSQGTTNAGGPPNFTSNWTPGTARMNTPMFQGTSSQQANIATAQQNNPNQGAEVTVFKTHYNTNGETTQIKYVQMPGGTLQPAPGQDSELAKYPMTEAEWLAYKKGQGGGGGGGGGGGDTTPKGSSTSWMKGIDFTDEASVKAWADKALEFEGQGVASLGGLLVAGPVQIKQANDIAKVRGLADMYAELNPDLAKYLNDAANVAVKDAKGSPVIQALEIAGLMTGKNYGENEELKKRVQFGYETQQETQAITSGPGGTSDSEGPGVTVTQGGGITPTGGGAVGDKYTFSDEGLTAAQIAEEEKITDDIFDEIDKEFEAAGVPGTANEQGTATTASNEGGLMAAPKKKKKRQPKKGGLAGKK